jgi:hypothetical protein
MCQDITLLSGCIFSIVVFFVSYILTIAVTRLIFKKRYELFLKRPSEGGARILLATSILTIILIRILCG